MINRYGIPLAEAQQPRGVENSLLYKRVGKRSDGCRNDRPGFASVSRFSLGAGIRLPPIMVMQRAAAPLSRIANSR